MKKIMAGFIALLAGLSFVVASNAATTPQERLQSYEKHLGMKENSIFKMLQWREIGPYFVGGRIDDIEAYNHNPYKFYIASASGGLWVTENNGTDWTPIFDQESSITIGDIAISQSNENLIWVGTGEQNSSRSSYAGTGVFKSTDAGKTWENMGLCDTHHIGRVIIDPHDNNIVYVAAVGHLFTYNEERGLFKTTDGGKTWEKILYISPRTGVIDVVMHPKDSNILFAATWQRKRLAWNFQEGGKESGIYKSNNGGKTWEKIANGFPQTKYIGRIGLAISASNPDVVYAFLDNQEPKPGIQEDEKDSDGNTNPFSTNIKGPEVYRSNDCGASWTKTNQYYLDGFIFTYGYYFGNIRIAPDNEDVIYLLGILLLKSTDGGKTFIDASHLSSSISNNVHVDMHALWINPNNSRHLLLGNDGCLNISYDESTTWQKIDNIPLAQCYTVHYDYQNPYYVYTGLQDNGINMGPSNFKQGNREKTWQMLIPSDGGFVQSQPGDPNIVYAAIQYGNTFRIELNGIKNRKPIKPRSPDKKSPYRFNWLSPFLISPHNPHTLYMGANLVLKSVDKGDHWMRISPDLSNQQHTTGDVPYATIVALDESPISPGLLVAGTDDGNVWIRKNVRASWKKINRGLPGKWISRIIASKYKKERIYVTLNGFREDDFKTYVYTSGDYGRTWASIKGNLPEEPVNVIREDPVNENILYLGTDLTVYVSIDRGNTWYSLKNNLPTNAVYDLQVHPRENELIIGTHGRGVFIVSVKYIQELASKQEK